MNQPAPGMLVTPTVRLVERVSGGAMGSVWLADHLGLHTQVMVKFIAPEVAASPEVVTRFTREAAAASRVKSPHVVQMLDHGVAEGGIPFIVMEHLEGRDLQVYLRDKRKLPPVEVATIVMQLSKALSRAHERGVLHRDIKPSNVFLCDVGAGETFVKLLDFGVAKTNQGELDTTKAGALLGTPFFMSPEQLSGEEVDHRSDLWALGVLAFLLLTGKRPFRGDTVPALTLAVHVDALPVPSAVDASVPAAFDLWFPKACARRREDRFQSARELAEALAIALDVKELIGANASGQVAAFVPPSTPADAPSSPGLGASAPGLGASAYNYSTHTTAPTTVNAKNPRFGLWVALALLGTAVVSGGAVFLLSPREPERPPIYVQPKAASPAPKPEPSPVVAVVAEPPSVSAVPSPSVVSSAQPPKTKAKPSAGKPKPVDDPFGDSRQ